jgi:hypothetical protein
VFRPFSDNELGFVAGMKADHIVVAPRADIIWEDEAGGPVYRYSRGGDPLSPGFRGAVVRFSMSCFLATCSGSLRQFWVW